MRVPVLENQVAPQSSRVPVDGGYTPDRSASERAIASAGRAVDAGVQAFAASREKARQEAIAAEVTDGETQFTRGVTSEIHGDSESGKTGFMSLQGRAAEADGAPVMQRIEKRREEIANRFTNDDAKKLFLQRTGRQVESTRSSVETFVSGQRRVADVASLKARADAATEAMFNAARVGDGATVQQQSIALEGPIRALAVSPEDAERDVAMWRRQAITTQLDAFLEVKRLDVAEALLNDAKDQLGPALAKKYSAELDKRKIVFTAEGAADAIVAKAQGAVQAQPFAEPDRAAAEAMLAKLPADVQEKATPIVRGRLAMLKESADVNRREFVRSAKTAYNKNQAGFFATPMADRLNDVDPEAYQALQNHSDRALDRAERRARVRANNKQAIAAQKVIDQIAKNEWSTLLAENPDAADLDEFLSTRDVSDVIPSELEKMRAKAAKAADVAGPKGASSFTTAAAADAAGFLPEPGATKASKDLAARAEDDFKERARREYYDFVEEKKRAPTSSEAADLRAKLIIGLPVNPKKPDTLKRNVEAVTRTVGGKAKPSMRERALQLKKQNLTSQQIADKLNDEGY